MGCHDFTWFAELQSKLRVGHKRKRSSHRQQWSVVIASTLLSYFVLSSTVCFIIFGRNKPLQATSSKHWTYKWLNWFHEIKQICGNWIQFNDFSALHVHKYVGLVCYSSIVLFTTRTFQATGFVMWKLQPGCYYYRLNPLPATCTWFITMQF